MYEECNLLLATHPTKTFDPSMVKLATYENKYNENFPIFCKDF